MDVGLQREHRSRAVCSAGRLLVADCVIAILAVSVAFAYASPPDPSWIPGIYDDHDYDDVLGMVTDEAGVSDSQARQRGECVLVGFVLLATTGRIPSPIPQRQTIRGPPVETHDACADPLRTFRQATVPLTVPAPAGGIIRSFCSSAFPLATPRHDGCPWLGLASR